MGIVLVFCKIYEGNFPKENSPHNLSCSHFGICPKKGKI